VNTYLVVGENQRIRNDDVLSPTGSEDNYLSDVLTSQGLDTPTNIG